jgi:hypothetical protein
MNKKALTSIRLYVPLHVKEDFDLLFNSSGFEDKAELFSYLISREILQFYKDSDKFNAYNLITRFKALELQAQRGITRLSLKKLTQTENINNLLSNLENQGHIKTDEGSIQDYGALKMTIKSLIQECIILNNVAGLEILKNKIEYWNIKELMPLMSEIEFKQYEILKIGNNTEQEKQKTIKEVKTELLKEK